jgi:hypothetical protein
MLSITFWKTSKTHTLFMQNSNITHFSVLESSSKWGQDPQFFSSQFDNDT